MPVHVATDLTPDQSRPTASPTTRPASSPTWDYDLLPIELADLQELDFDLDLLGFYADELAELLSGDVDGRA